jgi:predicted outer membrane repeat protein
MRTTVSAIFLVSVLAFATSSHGDTPVPGGDVHGTWTAAGSPYQIRGDITVPADSTLVIEPGVEAVFELDCGLTVKGTLTAVGTAQDSIKFTAPGRQEWKGALFQEGAGPIQLSFCVVERGAATGTRRDANGGGILSEACEVYIANSTFRQNRAVGNGGAVYLSGSMTAHGTISDCLFSGNHADVTGGGLYFSDPDAQLTGCRFVANTSGVDGGGAYCWAWFAGSVLVDGCCFDGNEAGDDGGGLMVHNQGQLGITVTGCEFLRNRAGPAGGALCMKTTSAVVVEDCVFSENFYSDVGAAVYLDHGAVLISGCTFERNYSNTHGALYGDGADVDIENCTFSSNWASGGGMDVRLTNGSVSIVNTVVRTNDWPYANLYCGSGSFSIEHCDLFKPGGACFDGPGVPAGLGDMVGVNANGDPCDSYANILLDPLLCDVTNGDVRIAENSPCLGAGEGGADIGAHGIGCETMVDAVSWGSLKAMFR